MNINHETALKLVNIGSSDTQADCADMAALLRAEVPSDPVARALIRMLERAARLPTWEDYSAISAAGYAEFDEAVGIRMVPVSNPVTGTAALAFRVGGA